MNYTRILICILIMSVTTYLIRMLPLTIFRKKIENNYINSFFAYVPYAVLSAMTFPEILYSSESMIACFLGLVTAVFLAVKDRSMLEVSLAACGVVFIAERILC